MYLTYIFGAKIKIKLVFVSILLNRKKFHTFTCNRRQCGIYPSLKDLYHIQAVVLYCPTPTQITPISICVVLLAKSDLDLQNPC